jgi:hypothetical protein
MSANLASMLERERQAVDLEAQDVGLYLSIGVGSRCAGRAQDSEIELELNSD